MPDLNRTPSGWQPPRWLFSVIAVLAVAWWVANQPPEDVRPAAPTADQEARFEPAIPVHEAAPPSNTPQIGSTTVDSGDSDDANIAPSADDVPARGEAKSSPSAKSSPPVVTPAPTTKKATADPLIIPNVTVKDQSGRVAFKGTVDLHPTFDRIARGEKFPHRNDGSTFRNLEKRLPKQPVGYYTEYVHPTPGIGGPGPQRIVIGRDGEAYYTHDHYNSFRKVRE